MIEIFATLLFLCLAIISKSYSLNVKAGRMMTTLAAIQSSFVAAEDGLPIHVLRSDSNRAESRTSPILFIHGSYHSANCFEDNFMPYFESEGFNTIALSLRGTKSTGMLERDFSKSVPIDRHVRDVRCVLNTIDENPIVIAHSFGGLILMKLLEDANTRKKVKGVVTLCSVPPSGNGPMAKRLLLRNFWSAIQIIRGFVFKEVLSSPQICRQLFFDERVSKKDMFMYMKRFKEDSMIGIDLGSLQGNLPSEVSASASGAALYLEDENEGKSFKRLCLGAEKDFIVDQEGVNETAKYFKVVPKFIRQAYHDCMSGPVWYDTARVIKSWIETV